MVVISNREDINRSVVVSGSQGSSLDSTSYSFAALIAAIRRSTDCYLRLSYQFWSIGQPADPRSGPQVRPRVGGTLFGRSISESAVL